MFCQNCGNPMNDEAVFCSNCGAKNSAPAQETPKKAPKSEISLTQLYKGPEPKIEETKEPTVQQAYAPPVHEYSIGNQTQASSAEKMSVPPAVQAAMAADVQVAPKKSGGVLKGVLIGLLDI